jgi:hypothetical protein
METNATPSPIEPKRYGTEAEQRAYMADVLGMPRPVWVSTPRAFVATEPSRKTYSRPSAIRSHKHYSRESEK